MGGDDLAVLLAPWPAGPGRVLLQAATHQAGLASDLAAQLQVHKGLHKDAHAT
jgi:hypothetical protein